MSGATFTPAQVALFGDGANAAAEPSPATPDDASRIDREFKMFHRDNPHVYVELVRLAREAVSRGHKRIGVKMLWEVLRWHFWLNTKTDDDFTLNNNYTSRYARLIMATEADLRSVFELRMLRS